MVEIREYPTESVYRLIIPEQLSEADVAIYLNRFEQALADNRPFGTIFSYAGGRPSKVRGAEQLERAWLKQHRPELSRLCFGIAMIATPSIFSILNKIMIKGIAPRLFVCPCTLVTSTDEAHAWLRGQHAQAKGAPGTAHTTHE